MKKSIKLFSLFDNQYHDWLLEKCRIVKFDEGDTVVIGKNKYKDIVIIISGDVRIYFEEASKQEVDPYVEKSICLGPNEVIGISEFLGGKDQKERIICESEVTVLVIYGNILEKEIKRNVNFARQFYKAVAIILADQLEKMSHSRVKYITPKESEHDEQLFSEFDRLFAEFKKASLEIHASNKNENIDNTPHYVKACDLFNKTINYCQRHYHNKNVKLGVHEMEFYDYARQELLPYLMLSNCSSYCLMNSSRTSVDFLLYEKIYENKPEGIGVVGRLIDKLFLESNPARAIRLRAKSLARYIFNELHENSRRKVAAISTLPPQEFVLAYPAIKKINDFDITLYGFGQYAVDTLLGIEREKNISINNLDKGDFIYNEEIRLVENQELIISPGELVSLNDKEAILFINKIYDMLGEGGAVCLGTYCGIDKYNFFLEVILNWDLHFRTEASMKALLKQSKFSNPPHCVWYIDEVFLFVVVKK